MPWREKICQNMTQKFDLAFHLIPERVRRKFDKLSLSS